MSKSKSTLYLSVMILLVTLFFGESFSRTSEKDVYALTAENIQTFADIYREIAVNYVDEIDPEKVMEAGIDGMLTTLDPYTVYIEKEAKEQLQIFTQGKYQGVGMLLNYRNNTLTVADPPFIGTPAAKAGIRAGDQILEVDGKSTKDMGFNKSVQHIRGPKGTGVTLKIKRLGTPKVLMFTLIREEIKIEDVAYAGMIDDHVGYIKLTRFSKNASREVAQALHQLKAAGMKSLIFDLRYNPGGVLEASVQMADYFLPKKATIVSTKGRTKSSNRTFVSTQEPIFGKGDMVVLVNGGSASASEIFAGAIQDHDRGIVLGDTTFGKGLVQTIFPLSQISALKMTTAKYYTPSGRCIQRQSYFDSDSTLDNDKAFKTDEGREVYGGGGIAPDIYVELPTVNPMLIDMRRNSLFFDFAVKFTSENPLVDSTHIVNDKILTAFKKYLTDKEYSYQHPLEKHLDALKKEINSNGYTKSILRDIQGLESALDVTKNEIYDHSIEDIKKVLLSELVSKYLGSKAEIELGLQEDVVVNKARDILNQKENYSFILKK